MLADLALAARGGKAMSYSRHEGFYKRFAVSPRRLNITPNGRPRPPARDRSRPKLAPSKNRTAPGRRGWQSTLTATTALYDPHLGMVLDHPIYEPTGETIILRSRGEDRALIAYDDNAKDPRHEEGSLPRSTEMLASTIIGSPRRQSRSGNHLLFEKA